MASVLPPHEKPLSPALFERLKHRFREVRISNPGVPAVVHTFPNPARPGTTMRHAQCWGEYYRVCCPFCNDIDFKLWINHLYGAEYDERYGRRAGTYLACCYKNNCLSVPGRAQQLENLIFGQGRPLSSKLPIVDGDINAVRTEVSVPGKIFSLAELADDHPALEYLRSRNFDPHELATFFNVGFCASASTDYPSMTGRIYIPVYHDQRLIMFQGRRPTGANLPIKYYTAGKKSMCLYNYDRAASQSCVVLVEGAPSVWRLNPFGVALFGKTLSLWQQNMIVQTWAGKPVFLMLDYGAETELEKLILQLDNRGLQLIPVPMPDERDPADYTRDELRLMLQAAANSVGVSVDLSCLHTELL